MSSELVRRTDAENKDKVTDTHHLYLVMLM